MQPEYEPWAEEPKTDQRQAWRTILIIFAAIGAAAVLRNIWFPPQGKELPQYNARLTHGHYTPDPRITVLLQQGAKALENSKLFEAEMAYREIVEKFPKFAGGHHCLACTLTFSKRYDEATAEYRRALEIDPKFSDSLFSLGTIAWDHGRVPEALNYAKQAIEIEERCEYHRFLGFIYDYMNDRENAFRHFEKALAMGANRSAADIDYIKKRIEALKK